MGTFKLGYVDPLNPYLSACALNPNEWHRCHSQGISMDVWREILPLINYSKIEIVHAATFGSFENGRFENDSLIAMLIDGTIDATMQVIGVDQYRFKATAMSFPIMRAEFGFVRAHPPTFASDPNLLLAVFSTPTLLLIIGCVLIMGLLQGLKTDLLTGIWNGLECALNKQKHLERLNSKEVWNPLILLGFGALSITYLSGFQSQRLSQVSSSQKPSITDVKTWIESRQKRLIVEPAQAAGVMVTQMVDSMFKKGAKIKDFDPFLMSDGGKIITLLCSRPCDTIFYGNVDVLLASNKRHLCKLEKLDLPFSAAIGGIYLSLAFKPMFPRKILQKINNVIHRVFSIDWVSTFWFRRYDIHSASISFPASHRRDTPIGLSQLRNGFIVYFVGSIAAVLVFLTEKYNWPRRIRKTIEQIVPQLRDRQWLDEAAALSRSRSNLEYSDDVAYMV